MVLALVKADNTAIKPAVELTITASLAVMLLRELQIMMGAKRRVMIGDVIKNWAARAKNGWEIMCTFGSLETPRHVRLADLAHVH